MNESDGESATENTKLMTSFVNSKYSKMESSLPATLVNKRDGMQQSVSATSVSIQNEMRSLQAMETPPETDNTNRYKAERPENFARASQLIRRTSSSRNNKANLLEELKYIAKHFIELFIPVSLCMLVLVATISTYTKTYTNMMYIPFADQTEDTLIKVWQSFDNAFILIGLVVCINILSAFLYKFGFYKVIDGLLILSSMMQLFYIAYICLGEIQIAYNISLDYITVFIMIWNFGVVGMVCIHWKGPFILKQVYQILIGILLALILIKYLPNWTAWVALGVISVWDLISVLCPKDPFRIFLKSAQEWNETIWSALLYSSHYQNSLPDGLPFFQNMSSKYEGYQQAMAQHTVNSANSLSRHSGVGQIASFPTALSVNNQGSSGLGSFLARWDFSKMYKPAKEFNEPKRPDTSFIIFMDDFRKEMAEKDPEGGVAAMSELESDEEEDNVSHILLSRHRSSRNKRRAPICRKLPVIPESDGTKDRVFHILGSSNPSRKKCREPGSAYANSFRRKKINSDEEESAELIRCIETLKKHTSSEYPSMLQRHMQLVCFLE